MVPQASPSLYGRSSVSCKCNTIRPHSLCLTRSINVAGGASRRICAKGLAGQQLRKCRTNGGRWRCAQWLENSAQVDAPQTLEKCWALWEDQELIPNWMPWISSVKVDPADSKKSTWTLSTRQFNREWMFSWRAQLLTPIKNQKIHWRSIQGSTGGSLGSGIDIANRGQIRFYRKGEGACAIKLTISYEVPDVLAPFAGALTPLVEGILQRDMRRFVDYAASHEPRSG